MPPGHKQTAALLLALAGATAAAGQTSPDPDRYELHRLRGDTTYELVSVGGQRQLVQTDPHISPPEARNYAVVVHPAHDPDETHGYYTRPNMRFLCRNTCPPAGNAARPSRDIIVWHDGRRTEGSVAVYMNVVFQDGRRVGPFTGVERIEFSGVPNAQDPHAVDLIWDAQLAGRARPIRSRYIAAQQPWITLTPTEVIVNGLPPMSRQGLRYIGVSGSVTFYNEEYLDRHRLRPPEDTVKWNSLGEITGPLSGQVTITDEMVRQPGRRPRPLSDGAIIEFGEGSPH